MFRLRIIPWLLTLFLTYVFTSNDCNHSYCCFAMTVSVAASGNIEEDAMEGDDTTITANYHRSPPSSPPTTSKTASGTSSSSDCHCLEAPKSSKSKSNLARMAYLISVHNNRTMEDAISLFRSIRSPGNPIVLIHLDKRISWTRDYLPSRFYSELQSCSCGASLHIDSLYQPEWGQWSMNQPTHWAMNTLLTQFTTTQKWDFFINLSGDSMPIYTQDIIQSLFGGPLKDYNFVTSSSCETGLIPTNKWVFPDHWHKRAHYSLDPNGNLHGNPILTYTDDQQQQKQQELTIYFGSQWMALRYDFVSYIMSSLKNPTSLPSQFRDWLIRYKKLMSDETFIPTLLMNVKEFRNSVPKLNDDGSLISYPTLFDIRYERMDEHAPSAFGSFPTNQRYEVPTSSSSLTAPRKWGPYFLGIYDLFNIKQSGALFIRKVSLELDPNIVELLPVGNINDLPSIRWPKEVKVSEKTTLNQWKKQMLLEQKHQNEAEKKN